MVARDEKNGGKNNMNNNESNQRSIMVILGGVILAGVAGYIIFMGINNISVENYEGKGIVINKEYHKQKTSYQTQKTGNLTRTIPITTAEAYVLTIKIDTQTASFPVTKNLYDRIQIDDSVHVQYVKKRVTGSIQITNINN